MPDHTPPAVGDLLLLDGVLYRITRLTERGTVQAEHPDGADARPRRYCSMQAAGLHWMELGTDTGYWYLPTRMLSPEGVVEQTTATAAVADVRSN